MPLERASKPFKDISLTFQRHPLTSDIITLSNDRAIARSIRNLVLTERGERFFNSELGSRVSSILFDNVDYGASILIKSEIEYVISTYEPRVKLTDVQVRPNNEDNEYEIAIRYEIIGIDVPVQQLTFALTPTR